MTRQPGDYPLRYCVLDRALFGWLMGFQAAFVRRIVPVRHRALRTAAIIAAMAIIAPALAFAADTPGAAKGSDAIFIAELGLLLLVGRLTGEAAVRVGQPAVMGQLVGGLLLGPSVLGLLWPAAQHMLFPGIAEQKSMISAVSEV